MVRQHDSFDVGLLPLYTVLMTIVTCYLLTGLKHCKINVHLLTHLRHYVKLFGPLWTHSAFAFEDAIGHLVKSHMEHMI